MPIADKLLKLDFLACNYKNINPKLIKRIKPTKPQYKLSRVQRMDNLNGAFLVNQEADKHLPILLIDDICTSGATFESIIEELHKNSINDVTCFATSSPCS